MIQFTKLRLSGFKSFVDPAELVIEPGMTGVVGPNGCGKSNLIEALRWVMGESSARQMRGGEMDDVIFGGTSSRPARNVAEVGLMLDNRSRAAARHDHDEIEVMRRIERGSGSLYRINGQETRARDVQLLFADAATGARSSGLVSQGRVGALINARPADRRLLLEEAAGISGLHSRRHEAELRLKNAEGNLSRLDDVLNTLAEQLKSLQKQARQANRYRTLSEQIRRIEAQVLYLGWLEALASVDAARAAFREAEGGVETATRVAADAARRQAEAAARLPDLRHADGEAASALHKLMAEREQLDAEAGRLAELRRDLDARMAQVGADLQREHARAADAEQAARRLADERQELMDAAEGEAETRLDAETRVDEAAAIVVEAEQQLSSAMEEVAAADAERAGALRRLSDAEGRTERLRERERHLGHQRSEMEADAVDRTELTALEMEVEEAQEYLEESRDRAEAADHARIHAQAARDAARDAVQTADAARARLKAEADALRQVLAQGQGGDHRPVLDDISAVSGYEPALAAALGEDLAAPADPQAPVHWDELGPFATTPPALPAGVQPLARFVAAPPALARRLSQVGVVPDPDSGTRIRQSLVVGQRLVSRDGDMWRWDGFTARAGAPSAMALRLAQRNRLREVELSLDDATLGLDEAEATARSAALAVDQAGEAERRAREAVRQAESELSKAKDAHARLSHRFTAYESRLAAVAEQAQAVSADLDHAQAELAEAQAAIAAFPQSSDGRDRVNGLRAALAERRSALVEARSTLDRVSREGAERRHRLDALDGDIRSWAGRTEAARAHIQDLEDRREALMAEIERIARLPDTISRRRAELLDRVTAAETARKAAADALVAAEQIQAEADRDARAAEAAAATAREERIRREAAVSAADQACRTVAGRIAERLDMTPEQLRELAGTLEAERPDPEDMQRRLDRLCRERDAMGPVNLRAEQEVQELEARILGMEAERDDLLAAIAKLRQAIGELNREGRQRLLASFQAVDQHFRDLFVKLFGGGRAHLALTESADPLEAGLEIMASPPGKRLQQLSLLSGGEQALTALALLFAVFMTNPAPICVLDEVDAPLDDANVDRFCSLVGGIADLTRTRFLVVTHHRMTMARMDRLYGVTMAERGVSQLVSVDLAQAAEMRDPA